MTLGRLNTHITYMLVSELAQFISLETELCLLHDLNVTNNGFEHVLYPLLKSACNIWMIFLLDDLQVASYDSEQISGVDLALQTEFVEFPV